MKRRIKFLILCFAALNLCFNSLKAHNETTDSLSGRMESYFLSPQKGFIPAKGAFDNPLVGVHRPDKAERFFGGLYQRLSSAGSPSQSLIFDFQNTDYHYYTPDLFAPYTYSASNIRFFQTAKPHSNLRYSSDLNSAQHFTIAHTQNLCRGLNLSLNYDVNYSEGSFAFAQTMNQFFNATANYISQNGRYHGAFAFVRNRAYVQENGGLTSDSLYLNQLFSKPETYPTNLQNAWSKHKSADFYLQQSYAFHSLDSSESKIFNSGRLIWNTEFVRGARLFKTEETESADSLSTRRLGNSLFWTNSYERASLPFEVFIGAKHELLRFTDSLSSPNYNLISPELKAEMKFPGFAFSALYSQTFSSSVYSGDYTAALGAGFEANRHSLSLNASFRAAVPYYIYLKHSAQTPKTQILSADLTYRYADWLKVKGEYIRLDSLARFSYREKAVFFGERTNLFRLRAQVNKDFKHWGLQTDCALQSLDNTSALHLPLFAAKQSLYLRLNLFKGKLETLIGVDLKYNTAYYADGYLPELGVFAYQDNRKVGNYLYCDVFVNAKLDVCNLFLALTHANAGLFGYDSFSTPAYPAEGLCLRWGLSWNFIN